MSAIVSGFMAVVLFVQNLFAPLLSVGKQQAAVLTYADTQAAIETVFEGHHLGSPALSGGVLWLSGVAQTPEGQVEGIFYAGAQPSNPGESTGYGAPILVQESPTHVLRDPTILSSGRATVVFFTKLPRSAVGSSTALYNEIGVAEYEESTVEGSDQSAPTTVRRWTDKGVVVGAQNGIDARGGWGPSALSGPDGTIWLYYTTNGPGVVHVYRSKIDPQTLTRISTEQVNYQSGTTTSPLSLFNVDVHFNGSEYVLIANANLSSVVRYVSKDGLTFKDPQSDINPILVSSQDTILGAPTAVPQGNGFVLYVAVGVRADGRWTSIQKTPLYTPGSIQTPRYISATGNATGGSNQNSSSGSTGSLLAIAGLLGVAGVLGLGLFGGVATAVAPTVVGGPLRPFGGTIVSVNFCIGGLVNVVIKPAGLSPVSFVWSAKTITRPPTNPPNHIGQRLLGLYFPVVIPCVGFGTHPPVWFGFDMFMVGASAI